MKVDFFTAEDFKIYSTVCFPSYEQYQKYVHSVAATAAKLANDKLERGGTVVQSKGEPNWRWYTNDHQPTDTHKALVICVQKIEKPCMHPFDVLSREGDFLFKCTCGQILRPTRFETLHE